ncbi:unnamed protein product [Urochloa decumbens]|uniref:BED-type domain-containing protein n=1 Tax=Urochloa decumbens TaxID=240449 RepID=A0ABC9F3K1_9POAL
METPASSAQPEQVSQPSPPAPGEEAAPPANEVIAIDDEADDEPTDDGTAGVTHSRGSTRKLTSAVWKDFKRVCDDDGVWKAKCNHCGKKLSAATRNGTNHLRTHLKICIYRKKPGEKVQTNLRFASSEKGTVAVENYVFDQDVARKTLYTMITLHEYPLSIVDHHGFRQFVSALQPLFKIGTRNTIRKGILNCYDVEKRKARMFLQKLNCRVAITTDLWTADNQKRGYMAVTGHFIDDSWTLRSCILRFVYVPCPHTGEAICDALLKCLQSWDLDCRVSTVTLDNCSVNDNMIGLMEARLGEEIHCKNKREHCLLDCLLDCKNKSYELLTELMNEYQGEIDQAGVGTSSYGASSSTVSAAAVLTIFKTLAATKKTSSLIKAKNELDRYLDEEPLPHDENEYFDVLGWWKVAGTRFPTLRLIARDILAIPITTVASESAFSTSGRILSEHRSRLTPQILEALMCSQSWFRHNLKGQDDGKIDTFWSCLEDIEEEMKDEPCISSVDSE